MSVGASSEIELMIFRNRNDFPTFGRMTLSSSRHRRTINKKWILASIHGCLMENLVDGFFVELMIHIF